MNPEFIAALNEIAEEKGLDKEEVFAKGMLDIEPMYGEAGWKVKFDQPAYDERYASHYVYSVPK